MTTMGTLKKWATDTLKNSVEYQQFCTGLIGTQLNFYRSSPMDDLHEILPYLTAYSDEYEEDDQAEGIWDTTWVLPIAIAIETEEKPVDDSGVTVWEGTDKAELLAMKAKEILKVQANACGIKGVDIRFMKAYLVVTEVGEADDIQANLFLTLGRASTISH